MKKLLIITLALFFVNNIFSQGIKVLYGKKLIISKKTLKDASPALRKNLLSLEKVKYFTLIHYKNESLYYPISKLVFKNVVVKMNIGDTTVVKETIKNRGVTKTVIYKNFKKNSLRNELTFAGKNYSIKDKFPNFNWQYTNDTKMLNKIPLKKAVGTYHHKVVTAWYAESIPIQDGPYYYNGLPGLILEVDFGNKINFKAMSIKYLKENPQLKSPKNLQPFITDKEFERVVKNI